MAGEPKILRAHKDSCVEMDAVTRATQSITSAKPTTTNQSIVGMLEDVTRSQEDSDYLMAMAIITGDVPYRFVFSSY